MPEMTSEQQAEQLEQEIENLTILIKASEAWGPDYAKDPESHARLIKLNATMERKLRDYFRGLKKRVVNNYINWSIYSQTLLANKTQKHSETIKAAGNTPKLPDNLLNIDDFDD